MALVIRFVDRSGFIREPFLDIVHVQKAFSTMKIVKIRLHNRMKDDFLANYLANKYNILIYLIFFENQNNNSGMNLHLVFSWVLLVVGTCKMLKFKR
jgi:hypothetical protein